MAHLALEVPLRHQRQSKLLPNQTVRLGHHGVGSEVQLAVGPALAPLAMPLLLLVLDPPGRVDVHVPELDAQAVEEATVRVLWRRQQGARPRHGFAQVGGGHVQHAEDGGRRGLQTAVHGLHHQRLDRTRVAERDALHEGGPVGGSATEESGQEDRTRHLTSSR